MALTSGIRSDLVQVATDWEDGSPVIALRYYVVAEAPDGRRWAHDVAFCDHVRRFDPEEGVSFYRRDDGEAAASAAELEARVARHLAAGGRLDPDHWGEIDPAYGSDAYADLAAVGYFLARERQEARDAGEAVPVSLADYDLGMAA